MLIQLDMNNRVFQEQWFALEKENQLSVLNCCKKIAKMDWNALYRDKGLRWELIQSRMASGQDRLYSIRISQKVRAVVKRSGNFLEFLTLHPDHDSAY